MFVLHTVLTLSGFVCFSTSELHLISLTGLYLLFLSVLYVKCSSGYILHFFLLFTKLNITHSVLNIPMTQHKNRLTWWLGESDRTETFCVVLHAFTLFFSRCCSPLDKWQEWQVAGCRQPEWDWETPWIWLFMSHTECWWRINPLFMQVCHARVSMLLWLVMVPSSITWMALFSHLHTEYIYLTRAIVLAGNSLLFSSHVFSYIFSTLEEVIQTFPPETNVMLALTGWCDSHRHPKETSHCSWLILYRLTMWNHITYSIRSLWVSSWPLVIWGDLNYCYSNTIYSVVCGQVKQGRQCLA